jgi:enamine deaminase RidA (YjgF/YER057c/UK114 family)
MSDERRLTVSSGAPWEDSYGYSRARVVGDHVFVAGTAPVMPPGQPLPDDPAAQAARCLEIIGAALEEAGSSLRDVVRTCFYLTRAEDFEAVGRAHGEIFREIKPVCTGVVVAALREPDWLVEIEATAIIGAGGDAGAEQGGAA